MYYSNIYLGHSSTIVLHFEDKIIFAATAIMVYENGIGGYHNLIWNSLLPTAITQLVQNVNKYQSP